MEKYFLMDYEIRNEEVSSLCVVPCCFSRSLSLATLPQ